MRQPRWTRHILKDIDPFVCLFEECKESLTLFKTVEDWLGHMRWQHTIVYSCQAVGHEREAFGSSQDLEDHIRREHPGAFTESQLPGLVKQGAVPTSNTIGALNFSLSLNDSQCLLCHTFDPKPVDAETMEDAAPASTPEQIMQSHILEHLEAIALLALPGSDNLDGVDSDARQSSPGSDAEKENEAEDLPSAVFKDTVTERPVDESVPDQNGHGDCWAAVFQEVKQSRLLEPHGDPILIELGEARQKNKNKEVVVEDVGATEETSLDEDASLDTEANLDKKLGIKVVFHPRHEQHIDLDILAVHGIGADPETTWTYVDRDPQDKSKVTKVTCYHSFWLGNGPVRFGHAAARNRLDGIAAAALEELGRFRKHTKDCNQRPILLICHCYGGIVMQQAYLTSKRHASAYPGIYDAITGIIFLGTPFQGSNIAHISTLRENYRVISQQNLQFKDDLLQTLERGNEILVDTVADFTREVKLRTAPPEIFCFYERRPTNMALILGLKDITKEFVADESSSTLPGYERRGLALDHFSMNKFYNNEDYHYISVVDELVKMAGKTRDIMRKRGKASNKESRHTTQQSHSATHRSIPMLPFPVAKGFAGRDGILEKIKAKFDYSLWVALAGPCGSGKTHVAVEYADGFLKENPEAKIFYVYASNAAEFQLSFDAIKDKMKLGQGKKGDTMGAVRDFLNKGESGQWLMIIDGLNLAGATNDADQPKESESTKDYGSLQSLLNYIPDGHAYGGNVLVTMRSKSMATRLINRKYVVDLPAKLSEDDVTSLLCGDNAKDSASRPYQMKIADLLQGSAGALALVRAYMETSGNDVSWEDLWKRVQASSSETNSPEHSSQTEEQVKATAGIWEPLYSQLGATHEEAACLLHILSLLDVQSIPMFLIEGYFDNKSQQAEQVKALADYGMLQLSVNRKDACIIPLVRLSANAMLDSNRLDDVNFFREAALSLVVTEYPSTDEMDNIKCKVLGPCAMAALRLCSGSAELRYKRAQLLLKVAAFEKRVGRYDAAVEFLVQCLDLCKSKMNVPLLARKKLQKEAEKLLDEAQKEDQQLWGTDSDSDNDGSDVDNATEHEFTENGSGVERDNDNDDVEIQVSHEDLSNETAEDIVEQDPSDLSGDD
ncbi:hypothetical protein INS49_010806 [Diaporthe citri]|uniref:uncharacterized protein n=1 Tax=Diaporthe citri TaxID=83186 RepID=UPI001C7E641E|nr:uncharacterized protein INS49_010806 [Diaporthe citri]KAG6359754.1 hypothetical protein INS49_010806 [Diaporthe citri]